MNVMIKHYGFLAFALIIHYPILYLIHIIYLFINGFHKPPLLYKEPIDFALEAQPFSHLKDDFRWLYWVILLLWMGSTNFYMEANPDNTLNVGTIIYLLALIISFSPIYKLFCRQKHL